MPTPGSIALAGLVLNACLAAVKLTAGILGHSTALVADGVESLADIVGSAVVWLGLRVAAKPADDDHPYGHGKIESLAALAVAVLMLVGAGLVAFKAIHEMMQPQEAPHPFTLWVLAGVIAIKETLFQLARQSARQHASTAALAEAWHHRADAITSVFALIGISLALWNKDWVAADKVAALIAAGVICISAANLARKPLAELTDAAPPELLAKVKEIAQAVPGVADVEKVLGRKNGTQYLMDMHLHVPGHLSVREAHDLSGKVKATIRAALPEVRDVLIHVEPAEQ
jgi:cation diffusion facilitator family transporter